MKEKCENLDTSFQELNQFRKRIDLNFKWNLIAKKTKKKTNLLLIAAVISIVTDIKNNILKIFFNNASYSLR